MAETLIEEALGYALNAKTEFVFGEDGVFVPSGTAPRGKDCRRRPYGISRWDRVEAARSWLSRTNTSSAWLYPLY